MTCADLRLDDENQPVERRGVLHHQVGGADDVHLGADQNGRTVMLAVELVEVADDNDRLAVLTHGKGPLMWNRGWW